MNLSPFLSVCVCEMFSGKPRSDDLLQEEGQSNKSVYILREQGHQSDELVRMRSDMGQFHSADDHLRLRY